MLGWDTRGKGRFSEMSRLIICCDEITFLQMFHHIYQKVLKASLASKFGLLMLAVEI